MKPNTKIIPLQLTEKEIKKFWAAVQIGMPHECWPYRKTIDVCGYGRFSTRSGPRVRIQAHRLAFFLHWGIDPEDYTICHDCDNPACCNPSHLFVGTCADNMKDKVRKGRQARGEKNGFSKLTSGDVIKIRERFAQGETSFHKLAIEYGVYHGHIRKIVNRELWAFLE